MDSQKLYVAKTLQGLEEVLAAELKECGAIQVNTGNRMVSFSGDEKIMYTANYKISTAIRILESFSTFTFNDIQEYYDRIRALPWEQIIHPNQTIAVDATVFNSNPFNNSHFAELKAKDAIADYFRDTTGVRPGVNKESPSMLVNIFVHGNQCHVSLDTSGTPLYKRGYRELLHEASLNEVLAAGMIRLSGWTGEGNFYDPMCGAATIPIEAVMFARKMPAGFFRQEWGFMNWKNYKPRLWDDVVKENNTFAEKETRNFSIYASDISPQSIRLARKNMAKARMMKDISIEQCAFEDLKPKSDSGTLIMNPPYNVRLAVEEIIPFYQEIGNHLKHHFKGHDAWIISSDVTAIKHIGLKASKKYILFNGPLEARFHKFAAY